MPHLKVKPFDTSVIESSNDGIILYKSVDNNALESVMFTENEKRVFIDIVKKEHFFLIKPNSITKGVDADALKLILNRFAELFNLEILHTNTQLNKNKIEVTQKYLKNIEDFYEFKSEYKSVKVEVGFGSARHLLYRAKEESETLFIGIEIHTPSIKQLLKQIHLQNIENIFVLNYDARLLLEMLPSNILDRIYVHFPVPWDKKPHRRVISRAFVNQALRTLKKGAAMELRTDSENYYNYALETFNSYKECSFNVKKNIDIDVISKYEERWRRMNKNIYTLCLSSLEESKELQLELNFDFDTISIKNREFPKESIVKDEFFVHFGKRFQKSRGEGFVVECSFGSFSMPEKKIIVVDEQCYYLPSKPVKSRVNQDAHNLIKEVLNG